MHAVSSTPAPYMTTAELAERWRISPNTLRNARSAGLGVASVKLGSSVRYLLATVEAYEAAAPVSAAAAA